MSDRDGLDLRTIWEVSQKVALPIALGMAAWALTAIQDHESRIVRIEATRYTIQDARADRDKAADARGALERALVRQEQILVELDRRSAEILDRLEVR